MANKSYPNFPEGAFTSENPDSLRLRVEVGNTGFEDNREMRFNFPLKVPTSGPVTLRVTAPINFIIQVQSILMHEAGVLFEAWRSEQGTPSGTWSAAQRLLSSNGQTTAPAYTPQITIDTGGGFTVNDPYTTNHPAETFVVKAAGSTAQASTVGEASARRRGLPPNTYYLKFTHISTGSDAEGTYNLVYEERP